MTDDDLVTELFDVAAPRVDGVDGPANGAPFLILKSAAADPLAEVSRVLKGRYTDEQQRAMLARGHAMKAPDGSVALPVREVDDLTPAIAAVRKTAGHDKARRFLALRAAQLGATSLIPTHWAADGSITKAAGMDDDLDALGDTGIIDAGDVVPDAAGVVAPTHEGDPDDPESPAWEAVDAARARAAVQQLSNLKGLVADMMGREDQEVAASGDLDDAHAAIELDQVLSALDCALAILAKFSVDEQAEADDRAQDIADQAAALGITKAIEASVAQIVKAGRVLSAANEQSLRAAHAALTEVLGRVPGPVQEEAAVAAEPTAVVKAADTDPETAPVVEDVTKAAEPEAPAETEPVAPVEKALDAAGLRNMLLKLVREMPDSEVTSAFQAMAAKVDVTSDGGSSAEPAGDAPAAAPVEPVEAAVVPEAASVEPAPAPVLDAAPAVPDTDDDTVLKAQAPVTVDALVAAFKAAVSPLEERVEVVAKAAGDADTRFEDALKAALTPLVQRVEKMEQTPVPGPMLHGQVPGGDGLALRGQAGAAGDSLMAGIRKQISEIDDPTKRNAASGVAAFELLRAMQTQSRG